MIRILLAGQGGQGVLSAGRFLAESGLHEGKEVSYLPAYGPEMRGGTANCAVIIAEEEIASPLCTVPDVLIALNSPSFHKFAPRVRAGGIIIVNGSISDSFAGRDDVSVYDIPADLPYETLSDYAKYVNLQAAQRFGAQFPESAYEGYEVLVEADGTSHFGQ